MSPLLARPSMWSPLAGAVEGLLADKERSLSLLWTLRPNMVNSSQRNLIEVRFGLCSNIIIKIILSIHSTFILITRRGSSLEIISSLSYVCKEGKVFSPSAHKMFLVSHITKHNEKSQTRITHILHTKYTSSHYKIVHGSSFKTPSVVSPQICNTTSFIVLFTHSMTSNVFLKASLPSSIVISSSVSCKKASLQKTY
jgi:hypothetical protein